MQSSQGPVRRRDNEMVAGEITGRSVVNQHDLHSSRLGDT